ncbi:OmpA family protein [Flavobacteriaceae bacterium R38]|nr:OmpA family protein [Flavobacteriaceae bacterium R38]
MKKFLLLLLCFQGFSQQAIHFSVYYDTDVYELNEEQKSIIKNKFLSLQKNDVTAIEIKGYADYVDTNDYNEDLSYNRAEIVYKYLSMIIDTNAIEIRKGAYGEQFSEQREDITGRAKDRRVDLSIMFKSPFKIPKDSLLLEFPVKEIRIGTKIELKNLYFFRGRTKMYDYSTNVLDSLGAFLKRNTNYNIQIQGHVCCGGDDPGDVVNIDTKTKTLSVDRARSIYEYLIKEAGIDPDRLSHKGFGFGQPKAFPETTIEDEKNNRRVEIMIVDF